MTDYYDYESPPTIWDNYFEAYRQGRQVGYLYLAVYKYKQDRDVRSLYDLRRLWLNTEYFLNQIIEKVDTLNRVDIFPSGK